MDNKEKEMLERLRPERHISAMMTLATIKFIKEECKKTHKCENCRFYIENGRAYNPCYFSGEGYIPIEWNEYDLTERIYK